MYSVARRYFNKLIDLCVNHGNALIVNVDHVASKQMQDRTSILPHLCVRAAVGVLLCTDGQA